MLGLFSQGEGKAGEAARQRVSQGVRVCGSPRVLVFVSHVWNESDSYLSANTSAWDTRDVFPHLEAVSGGRKKTRCGNSSGISRGVTVPNQLPQQMARGLEIPEGQMCVQWRSVQPESIG